MGKTLTPPHSTSMMGNMTCTHAEPCDKPVFCKRLCRKHYNAQWRKTTAGKKDIAAQNAKRVVVSPPQPGLHELRAFVDIGLNLLQILAGGVPQAAALLKRSPYGFQAAREDLYRRGSGYEQEVVRMDPLLFDKLRTLSQESTHPLALQAAKFVAVREAWSSRWRYQDLAWRISACFGVDAPAPPPDPVRDFLPALRQPLTK